MFSARFKETKLVGGFRQCACWHFKPVDRHVKNEEGEKAQEIKGHLEEK